MADTINNVRLPVGVWVNLYAATGITVGTQIQVQNLGNTNVLVNTGAAQPTAVSGYNIIKPDSLVFVSDVSPNGAWAQSQRGVGVVNVGVVE